MISYHPLLNREAHAYANGFRTADTGDLERIARGIGRHVWSPVTWDGGRRRQDCFKRADLCVLDFDSPEMSLAEALRAFCDSAHIIGTTRNHQKEKSGITCDRFRVVLRFDRPITCLRSYVYSLQKVVSRYPADPSPKDGARFFFPCREIVSVATDGYTETAYEAPPPPDRSVQIAALRRAGRLGTIPAWAKRLVTEGAAIGDRHTACYRLGAQLVHTGLSEEEIIGIVMQGPLAEIGADDVRRAVENGAGKGRAECGQLIGHQRR